MITPKSAAIRSNEENAYYHGVVVKMIADDRKWQPHIAHNWVKITFGVKTTTELTTKNFEELMENVRQHVLKYWKLEIPLPNEG